MSHVFHLFCKARSLFSATSFCESKGTSRTPSPAHPDIRCKQLPPFTPKFAESSSSRAPRPAQSLIGQRLRNWDTCQVIFAKSILLLSFFFFCSCLPFGFSRKVSLRMNRDLSARADVSRNRFKTALSKTKIIKFASKIV